MMNNNIKPIIMPKWGMEMSEGEINTWHVKVGDHIIVETDLVDVETAKIINTVAASDSGVVRAIVAEPGETHIVGALLGVIAPAEVSDEEIKTFINSFSGSNQVDVLEEAPSMTDIVNEPAVAAEQQPVKTDILSAGEDDSHVSASPVARRLAADYGVNLNNISGTGRHGRVSKRDLEAAVTAAGGRLIGTNNAVPSREKQGDDSHVKATPVARRLAEEMGINLLECRVSGNRGRVCKADVEAVAAMRNKVPTQTAVSAAPTSSSSTPIAISGMRKTIAERLQASKQTAPHFRVQIDAELDNLLATRKQINDANTEVKISVNDFIIKACASALTRVPAVNVQFDGERVTQFAEADISVAVAIKDGLITPIIPGANRKGLEVISHEMRDLATRAKLNRLKPEEFQGGSFCISNLGMYGIKQFDAIINPPQSAILAVGSGERRAVVKNGELAVATVVSLTLSSDHRIIDGAVAAEFMSVLKGFLEQPATMLI
ncbi:MAG: 2-oxo acid dehydrogenase subunit E2 [Porticoccaceae bacterium]|jgi:pyruvate dehydrogenase E2 component (dihydrolipoamide acetyltransferase)|nr:2-oxo acid dehydrogenase subunit E2 [Porticoccaceae bacterium]